MVNTLIFMVSNDLYYHFLPSKYAIDDLEKDRIRVSTLNTLNDPFEMMPYRRYKSKDRKPYNRIFREVSKEWGLLCFSKTWEKLLLWAHYADKLKGIALGFEIPQDPIIRVEYDTNPIRKKIKLTGDLEKDKKKFFTLAKVKFQEWSYEEEYRILIKLKDCIPETDSKTGETNYFLEFGNRLKIVEIVLGRNFNYKKDMRYVSKLADKLLIKVENRIATREGWENYKINKCGTKTNLFKNC